MLVKLILPQSHDKPQFKQICPQPIVIESMKGVGGIDTHLLFSGMAVSSVATVLSTSFISPAVRSNALFWKFKININIMVPSWSIRTITRLGFCYDIPIIAPH